MPRITTATVLLVAVLLPAAAHAAKWVGIGSKDQALIEVDASSIHAEGDGRMRAWYRESYARPQVPDSGAFSFSRLTRLAEFQCDKRLAATLEQSYSAADNSELKSETLDRRDSRPVTPDSSQEMVFSYTCKRQPKPVVAARAGKKAEKREKRPGRSAAPPRRTGVTAATPAPTSGAAWAATTPSAAADSGSRRSTSDAPCAPICRR